MHERAIVGGSERSRGARQALPTPTCSRGRGASLGLAALLGLSALASAAAARDTAPAKAPAAPQKPAASSAPKAAPTAKAKAPAPLPTFSLAVGVAKKADGKPAVTDAFVDAQVLEAERLLGPLGVHVKKASSRTLASSFAKIETRADRNGLASELRAGVINVYYVESLRDVDDPRYLIQGVHWRPTAGPAKDQGKRWIFVAAAASPTTTAHELGHYFGLPHVKTKNNLMSYERDGGTVFLDPKQGESMVAFARLYVRSRELVP